MYMYYISWGIFIGSHNIYGVIVDVINPLVLEYLTVTCVFLMVLTLLWSSNCGSGGFATASFGNVAYV